MAAAESAAGATGREALGIERLLATFRDVIVPASDDRVAEADRRVVAASSSSSSSKDPALLAAARLEAERWRKAQALARRALALVQRAAAGAHGSRGEIEALGDAEVENFEAARRRQQGAAGGEGGEGGEREGGLPPAARRPPPAQ